MSHDKNKEFDLFIKEKLGNTKVEIPENLWNSIEEKLESPVVPFKTSQKKSAYKWIYISSIAATLCVFLGLFLYKSNETSENAPGAENPLISEATPSSTPTPTPIGEEMVIPNEVPQVLMEKEESWKGNVRMEGISKQNELSILAETDSKGEGERDEERKGEILLMEYAKTERRIELEEIEMKPVIQLANLPIEKNENNFKNPATNSLISESMIIESLNETPSSVSRILNFMVATLDKRDEKFIHFTQDKEGSIKAELNLAFNKN